MMDLSDLLLEAYERGASDVHISAGEPPRFRIHGEMRTVGEPISAEEARVMIYGLLTEWQRRELEERWEMDLSLALGDRARFRVNVYRQLRGLGAAFRLIPAEVKTIEELGLPPVLLEIARRRKGLVLVTGPTGSGKSTTLAAIIDQINRERSAHIITIEDPIEFVHQPKECLISQREVGAHTKSFAAALRSALREDPDVILVGEMRDLETISLALTAAETGHLVLATLHTISAPKTVDRVVDVFPPEQQAQIRTSLAESLEAVVSQMLLRRADGQGRVAALEIMVATPAVRNLIREGKVAQLPSVIQTSGRLGMQTMEASIKELMGRGVVSMEEAGQALSALTWV